MTPELQPDVDVRQLIEIEVLNPVVAGLGLYLGRTCNQAGKLIIAGFAAGIAGMLPLYVAGLLHIAMVAEVLRASAGILVLQTIVGGLWATAGYFLRGRKA